MKHSTSIPAILLSCLLLTACAGQHSTSSADDPPAAETQSSVQETPETVSTETAEPETESAAVQTDAPAADIKQPVTEPSVLPADADEASPYATVTAEGWFTATVRALMPDYVSDYTTERAAVLQLFQDVPFFMILSPELCEQLTVGKTYAFHISEQELMTEKTNLFDDGTLSPDAVIHSYVQIDSVRTPEEGEDGLECWHVSYQPVS
ncbi:MAG: hypothetical protein J6S92_04080 [Oscillospiraceae bacterium]|nr:hypothetical protein [Oscillospiraceae bacterium]